MYFFCKASIPALGSTQSLIYLVTGFLDWWVKCGKREADHSPQSSEDIKHEWFCTFTPPQVFITCIRTLYYLIRKQLCMDMTVMTQLYCHLYITCQLHVSANNIFGHHQVGYNYRRKLHNTGFYKRTVPFQKLTRNLFLTLHGQNAHRQQRQLSKFLMRYQQFASHA